MLASGICSVSRAVRKQPLVRYNRVLLGFSLVLSLVANNGFTAEHSTSMQPLSAPNIMDRPEITQLLFHPMKVAKNATPPGAIDIEPQVEDGITIGCRLFQSHHAAPT